ncbi:MAG TPA: hypothetical protein DIT65_08350 [Cryomorphaceae bacterium]|nr:hypothetical protein [Cryomorphaceae bacterium]|tara:strand:- start:1239 stop:2315 length:1077 start_codon:yes stop_codon:yes gene_type:complete
MKEVLNLRYVSTTLLLMSSRILHIVKWYPNPVDPQNGIFVKKHIDATTDHPYVLGFVDAKFETLEKDNLTLYGAQEMIISAKVAALYVTLAKVQPDVVHFHCYAKDFWAYSKILISKGIPYIHSEHWSGLLAENNTSIRGIKRMMMRNFFEKAAYILPVSEALSKGIRQIAPKTKLKVVPNIIDEIDFSKPKEFLVKSFCVVGDVVFKIKRQDRILKVFRQLPSSRYELHFYGDGPDFEELKELTKHHINVTLHGRVSNEIVLQALPNHHAHIQFSAYETFGIATLEARKAGLWAISRAAFGSSFYADKGVLWAENEEELLDTMQKVIEQEKPKINPFKGLSERVIGLEIQKCYNALF